MEKHVTRILEDTCMVKYSNGEFKTSFSIYDDGFVSDVAIVYTAGGAEIGSIYGLGSDNVIFEMDQLFNTLHLDDLDTDIARIKRLRDFVKEVNEDCGHN